MRKGLNAFSVCDAWIFMGKLLSIALDSSCGHAPVRFKSAVSGKIRQLRVSTAALPTNRTRYIKSVE